MAELKQECLARGLEAKGNKQDLINRLQAYLEEHGGCRMLAGALAGSFWGCPWGETPRLRPPFVWGSWAKGGALG